MARRPRTKNPYGLEFHWAQNDVNEVEHKLLGLANDLDDLSEPMFVAASYAHRSMEERFQTATDPSGDSWEPWAPSYEPYALKHSEGRIFGDRANLHLTGDLREAATDMDVFVPTEDAVFIDTSDFPEYWAANNFGAARAKRGGGAGSVTKEYVVKRARRLQNKEFLAGKSMGVKEALAQTAREIQKELAVAGKNYLPARPFLGVRGLPAIAPAYQDKIVFMFEAWFHRTVEQYNTPVRRKTFTPSVMETYETSSGKTAMRARWPAGSPGGVGGRFKPLDA